MPSSEKHTYIYPNKQKLRNPDSVKCLIIASQETSTIQKCNLSYPKLAASTKDFAKILTIFKFFSLFFAPFGTLLTQINLTGSNNRKGIRSLSALNYLRKKSLKYIHTTKYNTITTTTTPRDNNHVTHDIEENLYACCS